MGLRFYLGMILIGKPVSTFPDHAPLMAENAGLLTAK
jgi:hypothetical protein